MMRNIKKPSVLVCVVIGILCAVVPAFYQNSFFITALVYTFMYASFGVAWNLIGGYGAQISWCHSSFVAIGAYTCFILYNSFGISPLIGMFPAAGISWLVATGIGYGSFRLRGPFFTLSTIAFAEIIRVLLLYFKDFTGGAAGMSITYKKSDLASLTFKNNIPFYYISLFLLVLIVLLTVWFERSKTGYYLRSIRGDEDAALSLGIETFKVKLTAFQLSAVMTSFVGTFYGFFLSYIDPTAVAGLNLSIQIGTTAIVGGLGTVVGPVLGAFVLQPLNQLVNALFGNTAGASLVVYGLIMIIIVIFRPAGLISFFKKSEKGTTKRRVWPGKRKEQPKGGVES